MQVISSGLEHEVMSALLGLAVGDALGVPVEFKDRESIRRSPVADMIGFGTYNQPPGTWSDDSSLAFCLTESLCSGFDPADMAQRFTLWARHNYWTARGQLFDIGIATSKAIARIEQGIAPELAGGNTEYDNGNGALMRILPLLFYISHMPVAQRFEHIQRASSITHRHLRSALACFYFLEMAALLRAKRPLAAAYADTNALVSTFIKSQEVFENEGKHLERILSGQLNELPEDAIQSSGYVIHTLEAALWCLLNTNNYRDAVLKAVNLGDDADTTGAVTGGLAGLYYGHEQIPPTWLHVLAKAADIRALAKKYSKVIESRKFTFRPSE